MATLREERARLQFLEEHGRGDEKVHIVFIDEEARERIKNEAKGIIKPKTKFVFETDDADMYRRFNAEKDRWIRLIVNKSMAIALLCEAWENYTDDAIRSLVEEHSEADFMLGRGRELIE